MSPDVAQRLAAKLSSIAERHLGAEAGFRAEAEQALEAAARSRGVTLDTRRELTVANGRADAVFNRLIIEWEPPGGLAGHIRHPGNRHAVAQLRAYVNGLAAQERRSVERLLGVACDGHFMIFARYRAGHWIVDEPVPVDDRAADELLTALISSQTGRALTAENLLQEFSGKTNLARGLTKALLDQLQGELGQRPDDMPAHLYRQWETFFAVATGVTGEARKLPAAARRDLADSIGVGGEDLEPAPTLFALQTYFALVTKLIASLSLSLWLPTSKWRLDELATSSDKDLAAGIAELHLGLPFRNVGLANAIEPDVFGWHLGGWRPAVRDGVRKLVGTLNDYDAATLHVSPEDTRDLLKDLYEGLMPKSLRHAIGQYFTPDWLAARLLDQAGYAGEADIRVLDPACGTGTFLVEEIRRLREGLRRDGIADRQALETVLSQIAGFDIDPLAVVAARTNYVLALGPLLRTVRRSDELDLPVYLADSMVSPTLKALMSGDRLVLETEAGGFSLPTCVDTAEELRSVCDLASRGLARTWSEADYVSRAARVCGAKKDDRAILGEFYARCVEQHAQSLDGLWPRMLRNYFMPAFIGRFDLIAGNPPWINWEHLPPSYRRRSRQLWHEAGLFVHGGMETMLGAGKKDAAMLMSYVTSDRLLVDGGRLAFVVPQTLFKTAGAGQGFRRFRIGDSGPQLKVEHVDDMVDLNPFPGAQNRTALMTWRRGSPTRYPVRYALWQRKTPGRIHPDATVDEVVRERTRQLEMRATPVKPNDRTSAWLTAPRELLSSLSKLVERGEPAYRAHEGVNSGGANGVYWVSVDGGPDGQGCIPVHNLHDVGDRELKKQYGKIEAELLHPLIRGRDVQRWRANRSGYLLFVQDPRTRRGIDHKTMRARYPEALRFLSKFKKELRQRAAYQRYFTRDDRRTGHVETGPYWSMFNVGDYTLAKHKVIWREQADEFVAAVVSRSSPSLPLPNHKIMLVACSTAQEAHYVCGLVNSLPARAFVKCYAIETAISTHVIETIRIPKFDAKSKSHQAVVAASRQAHQAVRRGREPDETAVDKAAIKIWGITRDELEQMRKGLDQLLKRDLAAAD